MTNNTTSSDSSVDRLFTDYSELYLLLEADPKVLHEAISVCKPEQLEKIMSVIEDNLNDYNYNNPSDIETAQQFLSVWYIALRTWDKETSPEGEYEVTKLDFRRLAHNQHWD